MPANCRRVRRGGRPFFNSPNRSYADTQPRRVCVCAAVAGWNTAAAATTAAPAACCSGVLDAEPARLAVGEGARDRRQRQGGARRRCTADRAPAHHGRASRRQGVFDSVRCQSIPFNRQKSVLFQAPKRPRGQRVVHHRRGEARVSTGAADPRCGAKNEAGSPPTASTKYTVPGMCNSMQPRPLERCSVGVKRAES